MNTIVTEGRKKYLSRIAEISFQIMFAAAFLTEFFAKLTLPTKVLVAFFTAGVVLFGFMVAPERSDK